MKRTAMLTGAAAAAGLWCAPRAAHAQANRTIAIATLAPSAANWPSLVSDELGFFKRYNIDIQYSLVNSIASEPESVVINTEERDGSVRFRIHVAPDDMGRVIGRRGRVAQAIRTLVAAAGARDGIQTNVDIVDD